MKNWTLIYSTKDTVYASILHGMLEENQIPVLSLNKLDSSYLAFGYIEVYVPDNFKEAAQMLMQNGLLN